MPAPRRIQRYGWKPSLPDFRDIQADPSGITIADEVDPRKVMQKPYDQLKLGSCTANAVAGVIEYNAIVDGVPHVTPSRLDIYFGERVIEGSPTDQDTGAFGRDGFKYAHSVGWIPEKDWPYRISKFSQKPPADTAHRQKIGTYKVVPRSINAFRAVLSNRQTVAFGFTVYESFESEEVNRTGIVPMPEPGEAQLGGHETVVVGYLRKYPHHALVRNSWGPDWALGGYCLMPWAMLMDRGMSSDFRTLYRPLGG